MAAVLCNGIGDLCRAVCTGIEKIMCLPCRACGIGCDLFGDVITSPFFLYIAVAMGCNLPPIVWAFKSNTQYGGFGGNYDCNERLRWLLVDSALCAINILAAFYVARRVQERGNHESIIASGGTIYTQHEEGKAGSIARITHLICYDKGFALYLLILIGFVIWQSVGLNEIFAFGDDACGFRQYVVNSIILGYVFLSLATVSFVCSVCCLKVNGLPR